MTMKMKSIEKEEIELVDREKWVNDSSVDHKGNVPLRARTGVWKASLFIIAIEFSERLSYFGIATSLIMYLTKVIGEDLKTAAKSVNNWSGVTTLMPLLGGFVADAYFGRFSTVLLSCFIYLLGLILLTMSQFVPSLKPSDETKKIHEIAFFIGIYLISIGTGGHKPSLESFGADQFEDDNCQERQQKMSFFNWWNFGLCSGILFGVTLVVYVQDHVSYGVADIILAFVMALSLAIFIAGRPFYRYRSPSGSPLTPLLKVFVAAFRKRKIPFPSDPSQLYQLSKSDMDQARPLSHTTKLKFLDKAAILEFNENVTNKNNPWRLSTVTRVEELKLIINMIPIWLSTIPFGICATQATTFFIKQASIMDRNISDKFTIPPASMYAMTAIGCIICITIYEKILVPLLRNIARNERGIKILQRIGIGMVFSIATMVVSALVETKRLKSTNSGTMSVFWLAPQFVIIGIGDGFTLVGLQEYFYHQVPDSMRSLGIAFYLSVIGAANFASSLLITVVGDVTSWFGNELNSSRLDYFYWLLAAITTGNLFLFVFLARRYSYKSVEGNNVVVDHCSLDNGESDSMA